MCPPATGQFSTAAPDDAAQGMVAPITNKPAIKNKDGSISTELSFSVNFDGKEVLLPSIIDGVKVGEDEAVRRYRSGKLKPLGVFDSVEEANAAAAARSEEIGRRRQPTNPIDAMKASLAGMRESRRDLVSKIAAIGNPKTATGRTLVGQYTARLHELDKDEARVTRRMDDMAEESRRATISGVQGIFQSRKDASEQITKDQKLARNAQALKDALVRAGVPDADAERGAAFFRDGGSAAGAQQVATAGLAQERARNMKLASGQEIHRYAQNIIGFTTDENGNYAPKTDEEGALLQTVNGISHAVRSGRISVSDGKREINDIVAGLSGDLKPAEVHRMYGDATKFVESALTDLGNTLKAAHEEQKRAASESDDPMARKSVPKSPPEATTEQKRKAAEDAWKLWQLQNPDAPTPIRNRVKAIIKMKAGLGDA